MPASANSRSAARKKSRVRSWRPRVAISTAERTSSGRATISSCAMNEPIDTATIRTGAASSFSISAAVSATICSMPNPSACSVAPIPRLSNVIAR